jgi:hypothetical protein
MCHSLGKACLAWGGSIYFCQGFLPCMMPSTDGWMDGQVTWWKKLHEKQPRRLLLYVMFNLFEIWHLKFLGLQECFGFLFHLGKRRRIFKTWILCVLKM